MLFLIEESSQESRNKLKVKSQKGYIIKQPAMSGFIKRDTFYLGLGAWCFGLNAKRTC